MIRESIDFAIVELKHADIHARLENWGMWCQPGRGFGDSSPMFRLYRSDAIARWGHPISDRPIIDKLDAQRIAKGVAALPEPHMRAVQWCYVKPCAPAKACRMLATNMAGLMRFLRDGRQILVNRRV
jgi:hypothetical protein